MGRDPQQQVHRRRVFYIPGYDPVPPRRYRELYRSESVAQAGISGYQIALAPKAPGGAFGWQVTGQMDGATAHAQVDVLVWSDIVRDSLSGSISATYLQLLRTVWVYVRTGTLRRLMRLRKGPVLAALYPIAMLILQLVVACLAAVVVTWGLLAVAGSNPPTGAAVLALLAGGGVFALCLRWFKRRDGRLYAYYLMHDYAFSAKLDGANPPALETRMTQFGDLIAAALAEDVDEVLVVGHSSGVHVAVSVLADLIRAGRVRSDGPALGFLSLGQVVPMVSFLPGAYRLRSDLQFLSQRAEVTWVDVSAPGDGCSFALCDPVAVSGVAPADKVWPLVVSAAFTQTLSASRWAALRWRFFRLHFQYLCAFDQPGDYDYFRITAGPMTLAARYAGRPASPSRLDRAVSKYTSVAA